MLIMLLMSSLPIILTFFLMFLNKIVSIKQKQDREKPSPYERGFNHLTPARLPFSIQFFLIAMIFLIFDIEIILIIPLIPSIIMSMNLFYWFMLMLIIYMCLMIGLIYEWNEQSIIWLK